MISFFHQTMQIILDISYFKVIPYICHICYSHISFSGYMQPGGFTSEVQLNNNIC